MIKRQFKYVIVRDGIFYGINSIGNVRKLIVNLDILPQDWLYSTDTSQWIKAGEFGQLGIAFKSQADKISTPELEVRFPLRLPKIGQKAMDDYRNLLPGPEEGKASKKADKRGPSSTQMKTGTSDKPIIQPSGKDLNRINETNPGENWNPYSIDSEARKDYEAVKSIRFRHETSTLWSTRNFIIAGAVLIGLSIIYLIISTID